MRKENQMLSRITKLFGGKTEETKENMTVNVNVSEEAKAALEKITAEFSSFQAEANALLAASEEKITELTASLASAQEALAAATEKLAALEADKVAAIEAAHKAKMDTRLALVKGVIGDEKASAFVSATEMLDDAAFEAASSALAGSVEKEAQTSAFTEIGIDAKTDVTKLDEENEVMKILKSKYGE